MNKQNTRATLLFDFERCPMLRSDQKERIRQRLASRLAHDGRLRIVAQSGRTQIANRAAAENRLLELLRAATHVPRSRRPTRPTAGSRERRLDAKQRRAATKRQRQRGPDVD